MVGRLSLPYLERVPIKACTICACVASAELSAGRIGSGRVESCRVGSGHDFAGFWPVGSGQHFFLVFMIISWFLNRYSNTSFYDIYLIS